MSTVPFWDFSLGVRYVLFSSENIVPNLLACVKMVRYLVDFVFLVGVSHGRCSEQIWICFLVGSAGQEAISSRNGDCSIDLRVHTPTKLFKLISTCTDSW